MHEPPRDEASLVGTTIGRYRILERIGEGGMGVVYRARQDPLERPVALKLVHQSLARESDVVSRFLREARIAASLTNPNTVTIYDFGRSDDGALYLAMEFVEGESLRQRIDRQKHLAPADAAAIGIQVCRSLLEAHKKHIAHRDLKPENILLSTTEDGTVRVKVLDYGLARSVDPSETGSAAQFTQVGMILGTPEYMAPEQAQGLPVDTRADIYSLGVVLYEMLTGVPPFSGDTHISLMASVIVHAPPPMRDVGVRIPPPPPLEVLVLNMLAKEPADRPRDALEVLQALKGFLLSEQPEALSQVFMDPATLDESEEDAPTRTQTPLLPETTLDDSEDGETSALPQFVEGDRTLVSQQAFVDDEEDGDAPTVTAPHERARREPLVDDSRTAPATPALLARSSILADLAGPQTVDSAVGDEAALVAAQERSRAEASGPLRDSDAGRRGSVRPRSDGAGRRVVPERPASDPARGSSPRRREGSDPERGSAPRTRQGASERDPAPRDAPRITAQIPGRRPPPDFRQEEEAHRELAALVTAEGPTEIAPPPRRRSRPEEDAPRLRESPVPAERPSRRARTEVLHVRRSVPVTFFIGAALAVVAGVLLALWWTGGAADEGWPAGYTPSVPPPVGWTGTYESSRGPLVLEQQGDSVAGRLGAGEDAVRLAGRADGPVLRFAWEAHGAGGTAQRSGRGELRWYVTPTGGRVLRATLGSGAAAFGAGALWATPRPTLSSP